MTVNLAGHEIPQYTPGAAYRQLEFLLGRIDNLGVQGDYTTQTGNFTGVSAPLRKRGLNGGFIGTEVASGGKGF